MFDWALSMPLRLSISHSQKEDSNKHFREVIIYLSFLVSDILPTLFSFFCLILWLSDKVFQRFFTACQCSINLSQLFTCHFNKTGTDLIYRDASFLKLTQISVFLPRFFFYAEFFETVRLPKVSQQFSSDWSSSRLIVNRFE